MTGSGQKEDIAMVNATRLKSALRHAETHVREWGQSDWGRESSFGTAFCLFGHGVNQAGGEFLPTPLRSFSKHDYSWVAFNSLPDEEFPWEGMLENDMRVTGGRLYITTLLAGARLFGLDEPSADELSAGDNTMEALCSHVARILDEPWHSPWHAVTATDRRVIFHHQPDCATRNCVLKWYVYETEECSEEMIEAPWDGEGQVRVVTYPRGTHALEWCHADEIRLDQIPDAS